MDLQLELPFTFIPNAPQPSETKTDRLRRLMESLWAGDLTLARKMKLNGEIAELKAELGDRAEELSQEILQEFLAA